MNHRIGFSGYAVKFSPFRPNIVAIASSQYFGIAGNGRVSLVDTQRDCAHLCEFQTRDGCFDAAFSEKSDNIIAAACGDGIVRIFDSARPGDRPVSALAGHTAETYSVDWNGQLRDLICSASWDRSVRVWDTLTGKCTGTYSHSGIAYEATWNPRHGKLLASVGGDGQLLVYDLSSPGRPVQSVQAHQGEILCLDWNKYRDGVVATGSVDKQIKVWDLRNTALPIHAFTGHQLAVRRVKWSPHSDALLLSCAYDMSVKLWSTNSLSPIDTFEHHSEFVIGIDFSIFERDLVASTGWDRQVALWTLGAGRPGQAGRPPAPQRVIRQAAA